MDLKRLCRAFQKSSTPDIRLACFTAVVFLSQQVTVTVCQNAAISGCADSQLVDSSLTLKCRYIGKRDVLAIYWYNGSNSDILVLRPGSNVPHCDVFLRVDISFDPHRISYTCNASSNVYTLTINPLQKLDDNVPWSCTFIDPEPDPVKAECIIHLSETTDVTAGDGRISVVIFLIVFAILILTVVIILETRKCILIIRKKSRRKIDRRNREQCDEDIGSIPLQPANAEEVECQEMKDDGLHTVPHQERPNVACTWDKEDPHTFLD